MIYQNDIANLKTDLNQKIGQKIIIKGSLGRNRPFEKEATLEKSISSILLLSMMRTKKCNLQLHRLTNKNS